MNCNRRIIIYATIVLVSTVVWSRVLAFEAIITNERSGDVIHVDNRWLNYPNRSCFVADREAWPAALQMHEIIIACSDDHKVIVYNRSKRMIDFEIAPVQGAMNVAVHHASSRLFVTNEGIARASVFDLSSGQLIAELPTGLEPDGVSRLLTTVHRSSLPPKTQVWCMCSTV